MFRHLHVQTPTLLMTNMRRAQLDHRRDVFDYSLVEWMHDDGLDAVEDIFQAGIWQFPGGSQEGKEKGALKQTCKSWEMFQEVPDLNHPGQPLAPDEDFDWWRFFKNVMRIHEGEVRMVAGPVGGQWRQVAGPPPLEKSFWHCQYACSPEQREVAERLGCRGAPGLQEEWARRSGWARTH